MAGWDKSPAMSVNRAIRLGEETKDWEAVFHEESQGDE